MVQTFDLVLKGASVVNHDGEGVRDVAISGGRIAALGDLAICRRGRDGRRPRPARPARRHRHPGALPRAGPRAQGRPRDRQPRGRAGRRHRRVRDAQHQAADHHRRDARRQARARQGPHALRLRLLRRRHARERRRHARARAAAGLRPASRCSWAPRPATCWSTTRPSLRASLAQSDRRAAFHSEDESRLKERMRPAPPRRSVIASRCGATPQAALHCDRSVSSRLAEQLRQARARAARLDRRRDGVPCRPQGLGKRRGHAAPSHARRARLLPRARHVRADEPAGPRRAHRRAHLGGAVVRRRRRARLRPRAAHARGEGPRLSRLATPA